MASWVLSECGLRPLPKIYPKPRTWFYSNPLKIKTSPVFSPVFSDLKSISCCSKSYFSTNSRERKWEVKVSAPSRVAPTPSIEENINGVDEFNPGAPPPFKLADIKNAIPKHCWVKNPWRSMSYVVRDVAIVFGLAVTAAYFNNWIVWPLYWIAQGTMFWALFVLGHDW